jgi:hypothetical protein
LRFQTACSNIVMCGRYSLADFNNRFTNRFKVANYIGELQPRFNVAPEQAMPVVVSKVERGRQLRFAVGADPELDQGYLQGPEAHQRSSGDGTGAAQLQGTLQAEAVPGASQLLF